jgi:hypothetical protein
VHGRQPDFEVVFGPDGIWVEFLWQAPGYIATEIVCESKAERRYQVRDFWSWHRYFELFRDRFAAEYERFGRLVAADGVVEREEFVGAYDEKDRGDEDELVPGSQGLEAKSLGAKS